MARRIPLPAKIAPAPVEVDPEPKTTRQPVLKENERLALLYSDGSIGVLTAGSTIEKAEDERRFIDKNERDLKELTRIGIVRIEIIEEFAVARTMAAPHHRCDCPFCQASAR